MDTWNEKFTDLETFFFSSDDIMHTTLRAAAVSEVSEGVSQIPMLTGHGYAAGSQIFIVGTTNYNGISLIAAVASTTININRPFVSETVATADLARPGFQLHVPGQLLGYELHLAAACGTAEDFEIHKDADRGVAWDYKPVDEPMNGVEDIGEMFAKPVYLEKNDIVRCTFPNTDDNLFGLYLYARRLG